MNTNCESLFELKQKQGTPFLNKQSERQIWLSNTVIKNLVSTIFYSQNAIFLQNNFTKIWLNVWLRYFCVFIQIFCRQIGNFLSLRNIFENQCKIFASFLNYFVSAFNTIADTGWIHCIVFQYKIFAYDKPKLHKYARYFKKDAKLLQ